MLHCYKRRERMIKSVLCRLIIAGLCLALFVSYFHSWFYHSLPVLNNNEKQETLLNQIQPPKIVATSRNRTLASSRVLVYNRMPKCSSTAMTKLLHTLARPNKFQVVFVQYPARSSENDLRNTTNEIELVDQVRGLQNQPGRSVYIRHVRNPDWLKHNLQVNLVNMVRDPIQRMMSWFYFIRYTWTFKEGKLFR